MAQVYAIYLANMTSPYIDPGEESLECRFYKIEEIPWDEIAFTAVTFSLKKYIENLENNSTETFLGFLDKYKKWKLLQVIIMPAFIQKLWML